jgi:hypothetical protein
MHRTDMANSADARVRTDMARHVASFDFRGTAPA